MADAIVADQDLLDRLTAQAQSLARRRRNFNFHPADDSRCHRLLNAVEPGAYIQPHRHLGEEKDETMAVVRGRLGFVFFDDAGRAVRQAVLGPGQAAAVLHIPRGVFHTCVSLESGSVFLEAKAGPYAPSTPDERAPWAPAEGSDGAAAYLAGLRRLFPEA